MALSKEAVSSSILSSAGKEVKTGVLSILEKKGLFKSDEYQLCPMYWRLVSYAGQAYFLGHPKELGELKVTKKLLVQGCSTELQIPHKVLSVSPHSNENYLCIQYIEKITFLKAESRKQRNLWVQAIRNTLSEQTYHSSTLSTTSTDSVDSGDLGPCLERLPKSVQKTADTAPRSGNGKQRVNTSPVGQFQKDQTSTSSITQALTLQSRRSSELSKNSSFHSLNSDDKMREEDRGIYEDGTNYNRLEPYYHHGPIKNLANNSSTSQPNLLNQDTYSVINDHDRQSVSNVDNLGLRSDKNARFHPGGESVPPELPKRNYRNHTPREVQAGVLVKKQSSKKQRAPKPPDREPIDVYITRFGNELSKRDGVIVSVNKTDLSPKTIKLVCIADCICIAALPGTKLRSSLHIDDVIVKVNQQTVSSIEFCYKLFGTTDENKVQLHVKRVMHGIMCHVTLSANGDIDSLGLEFGNQSQGNELTAIDNSGLVAKSGSPSRPQTNGVVNGGMVVNWSLVEINQSPVALDSSPKEVLDQIRQSGCVLALVFIPVDVTNVFREKSRQVTEHTSEKEHKC